MKKTLFIILFLIGIGSATSYAQMRLSLQIGAQLPTGDFAELAATGFGLTGTFEYSQNTPLSFTGSIGYNSWGPKNELPAGWDYKVTSIPILIGMRYYLSHGDFHPYIGAELGIHLLSFTISREVGNTTVTSDDSESKFGFAPMFGFRYHISPTVDLDFNFKYNIISTDNSITYMGINGGVQFGL